MQPNSFPCENCHQEDAVKAFKGNDGKMYRLGVVCIAKIKALVPWFES